MGAEDFDVQKIQVSVLLVLILVESDTLSSANKLNVVKSLFITGLIESYYYHSLQRSKRTLISRVQHRRGFSWMAKNLSKLLFIVSQQC